MVNVSARDIEAIGITNQRETTIVWDKNTGVPVYNAIVWQCRRTAPAIERLCSDGMEGTITETTVLIPDAYFSATKIAWILEIVEGARQRAERVSCFLELLTHGLSGTLPKAVFTSLITQMQPGQCFLIFTLLSGTKSF